MENPSSINIVLSQEELKYSIFVEGRDNDDSPSHSTSNICKLSELKMWAPDSTILQNAYKALIKVREENNKSHNKFNQISWLTIQINLETQNFWDICTTLKNRKWNFSEKISGWSCFSEKEIVMWAEKFKIPTEPREDYDGSIHVTAWGEPINRHTFGTRRDYILSAEEEDEEVEEPVEEAEEEEGGEAVDPDVFQFDLMDSGSDSEYYISNVESDDDSDPN